MDFNVTSILLEIDVLAKCFSSEHKIAGISFGTPRIA